MSECVVRMEMPQRCAECPIQGYALNCRIPLPHDKSALRSPSERPSWCPILAVLPEKHGELIDRKVVYEKIKWWQENTHDTVTKGMLHEFYLMLFGVPAIVPAERSET